MVTSIAAAALVILIAYFGFLRGFFGSLLHMICVIAAGAIAFALWEPLAYFVLDKAPTSGIFYKLSMSAWGFCLVLPFAVALAILRVIVDKAVPANATLPKVGDMIGGAACGAVSGVISVGILVIGIGFLWLPTERFPTYQRMGWDSASGSLVVSSRLMLPVDEMTAGLYGRLSKTTLASRNPLARLYPNLADASGASRLTLDRGRGRVATKPNDFSVVGAYTVGLDDNWQHLGGETRDFLRDSFNTTDKIVTDTRGESLITPGAYLAGYAVEYRTTAREGGSGQVVVTAGQIRLVCENADGGVRELYPVAVITRADQPEVLFARHRFDSQWFSPASMSEASPAMVYEFLVPAGYRPAWMYLKNIRTDVSRLPYRRFIGRNDREQAMRDQSILGGVAAPVDESRAVRVTISNPRDAGLNISDKLSRLVIQDGRQGGLQTNERRHIIDGEHSFNPAELRQRGMDAALRIDTFAVTRGAFMVQVQATPHGFVTNPAVNLNESPLADAPRDQPIYLVDTQGVRYACVGYIYEDRNRTRIRYTRSLRLEGLLDLPSLPSRSRRDQEVTFLFEVTQDVQIAGFAIGDSMYIRFEPSLRANPRAN